MSVYFKTLLSLTDEDKRRIGEMHGKILQWILEGRSTVYMTEQLGLDSPAQLECNLDEALYVYMRQVGRWRFFKTLFRE